MDFLSWMENRKHMAKGMGVMGPDGRKQGMFADFDVKTRALGLSMQGYSGAKIAGDPQIIQKVGIVDPNALNRSLRREIGITDKTKKEIQSILDNEKQQMENRKHMAKGMGVMGPDGRKQGMFADFDVKTRALGLSMQGYSGAKIAGDPQIIQKVGIVDPNALNRSLRREIGITDKTKKEIQSILDNEKQQQTRRKEVEYDTANNRNRYGHNPERNVTFGDGRRELRGVAAPTGSHIKIKKGGSQKIVPAEEVDHWTDNGWQVMQDRRKEYPKVPLSQTPRIPSTVNPQDDTSIPDVPMIKRTGKRKNAPIGEPDFVPMQRPMVGKPHGSFTDNDIQSFFGPKVG